MTYEEKKAYLSRYWEATHELMGLVQEFERWMNVAVGGAISFSDAKTGGSSAKSRIEYAIANKVDIEAMIREDMQKAARIRAEVKQIIDQVPKERQRAALKLHYIGFMSWENVADTLGISTQAAHGLHRRALEGMDI